MEKSDLNDICVNDEPSDPHVGNNPDSPLPEGCFRMSQRDMLMELFHRHGRGWLAGMVIVVTALCVFAVVSWDIRWLIAALMTLFILLPMCMAFLYINYALHPLVAFNVLPHRIFSEAGNDIRVEVFAADEEGEWKPVSLKIYSKDQLGKTRNTGNGIIMDLVSDAGNGFVWIPAGVDSD